MHDKLLQEPGMCVFVFVCLGACFQGCRQVLTYPLLSLLHVLSSRVGLSCTGGGGAVRRGKLAAAVAANKSGSRVLSNTHSK